jgi:hypothetical protein
VRPRSGLHALPQCRDHRAGVGVDATPEEERLRGLLHQHAEAVEGPAGVARAAPAHEGGRLGAVHHVVDPGTVGEAVVRDRRQLALEARRGAVDHEVEAPAGELRQAAALHGPEAGRARRELDGLRRRAVADHQGGGALGEQRPEHAARGAACAEQQHPRAREHEPVIAAEVPDQPGAVRVVAAQPPAVEDDQGVDRARRLRALAALDREREGLLLEGHGDVEPPAALGHEAPDVAGEIVAAAEDPVVDDVLPGLARERGVDERRLAVRDRIPDDGVAVGHDQARYSLSQRAAFSAK